MKNGSGADAFMCVVIFSVLASGFIARSCMVKGLMVGSERPEKDRRRELRFWSRDTIWCLGLAVLFLSLGACMYRNGTAGTWIAWVTASVLIVMPVAEHHHRSRFGVTVGDRRVKSLSLQQVHSP